MVMPRSTKIHTQRGMIIYQVENNLFDSHLTPQRREMPPIDDRNGGSRFDICDRYRTHYIAAEDPRS
jgi:hypothetical protein